MKVGIVSSWMETLSLFSFLTRYNHEYVVYYDSLNAPYWAKNFATSLAMVKKWVDWLKNEWVEKIIVPPVYELVLLEKWEDKVLPLFKTYLLEYVFKFSLVWKIGMIWELADIQKIQTLVEKVSKEYVLTENQKSIKKFSYPFHYWCKEEHILNWLLSKLSRRSYLTNSLVKYEFRYFKDANVDTVVPCNYAYFNAQRTLWKLFNTKKTRFHWLEVLEKIFCLLVSDGSQYSVSIYATDQVEYLKNTKRLMRLLQRWKSVEIKRL